MGIHNPANSPDNEAIRASHHELKKLNELIDKFNRSSDKLSKWLIGLTVVLVILTTVLIWLTQTLITDAREETASQINVALNTSFFSPQNILIINAIESNHPILVENHGQYTDAELDNYLGSFDTIESSLDKHYLDESDFCDSFSYYIEITSKNTEIQNYILSQQKQDSGFFVSLKDLENRVAKSNNSDCNL